VIEFLEAGRIREESAILVSNDGGLLEGDCWAKYSRAIIFTLMNASCVFLKVIEPTANARDYRRCASSAAGKSCE
jgi:hypothetical protein